MSRVQGHDAKEMTNWPPSDLPHPFYVLLAEKIKAIEFKEHENDEGDKFN